MKGDKMMRRRKYQVQQQEAPIKRVYTSIKEIEIKEEDVDTIKIRYTFENGRALVKTFKKYSFEYRAWREKKVGDEIVLETRAGIIVDAS